MHSSKLCFPTLHRRSTAAHGCRDNFFPAVICSRHRRYCNTGQINFFFHYIQEKYPREAGWSSLLPLEIRSGSETAKHFRLQAFTSALRQSFSWFISLLFPDFAILWCVRVRCSCLSFPAHARWHALPHEKKRLIKGTTREKDEI